VLLLPLLRLDLLILLRQRPLHPLHLPRPLVYWRWLTDVR
jgi:hypothetical protein